MTENVREFHCGYVSASEFGGDHFQVLFAKTQESHEDEDYLVVQRQFEMPDKGRCYVETNDKDNCGHFVIRNARLTRNQFEFEFGNRPARTMKVSFGTTDSAYADAKRMLQIMIPDLEFLQPS
jgi:hypothetical protein